MCHPPALVGCCEVRLHCAERMATEWSGLPPASRHAHGAVASVCFPRCLGWLAWQCHFGSGHLPHRRWVAALLHSMPVGRRCCESVHCHNDSVGSWLRVLQHTVWRWALQWVFCQTCRQVGGGQNRGHHLPALICGFSGGKKIIFIFGRNIT